MYNIRDIPEASANHCTTRMNVSFWTDPHMTTYQWLATAYQNESAALLVIAETFDS